MKLNFSKDRMTWNDVSSKLPGLQQEVFVYCSRTGRIDGPVRLDIHRTYERTKLAGIEIANDIQHNRYEGIGVFPFAWFQGGMQFIKFMPTHWTAFPKVPPINNHGAP